VGPKIKGGGRIAGIAVGDHLMHWTGRDERAETQVNHDPGTGRLQQRGQLLRLSDARLKLEPGRVPDRGLDEHQ